MNCPSGRTNRGELALDELREIERAACCGPGICNMMGTANTACVVVEAAGLSLPGNATIAATCPPSKEVNPDLLALAAEAGERVLDAIGAGLTFRDIVTTSTLHNAIAVVQAIGGSTNLVLHLAAVATELDRTLALDDWDRIGQETPLLCKFKPASPRTVSDFGRAGGVPALLKRLCTALELDVPTAYGPTLSKVVDGAQVLDPEVIRSPDDPLAPVRGIAILRGNLAPDGAVIKVSGVDPRMMHHVGPARVYDCEEDVQAGLLAGHVQPGDVLVVRYEGPRGGPGMRELSLPAAILVGMGLSDSVADGH